MILSKNQKVENAGFWPRLMAQNIDLTFSIVAFFLLNLFPIDGKVIVLGGTLLTAFYFVVFESSKLQATPGKLVMKLKVVDKQGSKITFFSSFIRTIAKSISVLTLFIGFSMIEFTREKQGLHDFIARTRVIFNDPVT